MKKKAQPAIDAFSWEEFQRDPPFATRFLITQDQSKIQTGHQHNSQAIAVTHQTHPKYKSDDLQLMLDIFLKLIAKPKRTNKDEFNS